MTEMRSQSFQVSAGFKKRKKSEKNEKKYGYYCLPFMSAICLFIHTCVCLFVCTQWWPSRFFIFYRLRGSTTAFVSFRYILNSKQNTFAIHLLSLQSVALREKERQTFTQGKREREEDSKRLSIYFLRHLRKFGENSLALLNCKIRPQIKIPPPLRPHENKRRLGRILLALMDARLSYWRECKYAIHGHAMSGCAWQRLATHLHVVKYANNSKIYRNFTDSADKVRRTTSKS